MQTSARLCAAADPWKADSSGIVADSPNLEDKSPLLQSHAIALAMGGEGGREGRGGGRH